MQILDAVQERPTVFVEALQSGEKNKQKHKRAKQLEEFHTVLLEGGNVAQQAQCGNIMQRTVFWNILMELNLHLYLCYTISKWHCA